MPAAPVWASSASCIFISTTCSRPRSAGPCLAAVRLLRNNSNSKGMIMRIHIVFLLLLAALFGSAAAHAHAFLDHASPLVGSTVASAPHEVTLTFTQSLEPAFSTITVTDPGGADIGQGKAQVSGNIMRIGIKAGGAGTYRVRWHALSVDTHTTQG